MQDILTEMLKAMNVSAKDFAKRFAHQRYIPINGKIDEALAKNVIQIMMGMDMKEISPITLLINSGGGSAVWANNIGSTIQALNSDVEGVVVGRCASMAIDILLHCTKRSCLPCATFFLHYTRGSFDFVHDFDDVNKEGVEAVQRKIISYKKDRVYFYMKKLKMSSAEVDDLMRMGEKYDIDISATDAKSYGIVEEINTSFKFFK